MGQTNGEWQTELEAENCSAAIPLRIDGSAPATYSRVEPTGPPPTRPSRDESADFLTKPN